MGSEATGTKNAITAEIVEILPAEIIKEIGGRRGARTRDLRVANANTDRTDE